MSTKIKIFRDSSDFPSYLEITKSGKKYTVYYDRNQEIRLEGRFTAEILELARLVYPFAEKTTYETLETGQIVHAQGEIDGVLNAIIYTVPAGKKLFIVSGNLTTLRLAAGASPNGSFHIYSPNDNLNAASTFIFHRWVFTTTDALSNWFTCDRSFPQGWQLGVYADADTSLNYSFIGVLCDAGNRPGQS